MNTKKTGTVLTYRLLFLVCVLAIILWLAMTVFRPKSFYAKGILRSGELEMVDGNRVSLAGVKIKPRGDDKHEAAIFLLSEMTKSTELWIEKASDGYKIWVGCKNKFFVVKDCSEAVLVNEKLLELGLADRI